MGRGGGGLLDLGRGRRGGGCGVAGALAARHGQGDATELANRLLAVQEWSEVWYHCVASRVIRLACGAEIGPSRSAEELLERLTAQGLERLYAGHRCGPLVKQTIGEEGLGGAALRYGDFFDALAGRFDGAWSYDDADIAVLSLPVLAAREDADAAFRLLLEDLAHYGIVRKDRDDHGMTVYLDEFSAVSNGARAAIDLAERLRDAGVGVVFVVQSYEGLGDEHQAARLRDRRRPHPVPAGAGDAVHRAQPGRAPRTRPGRSGRRAGAAPWVVDLPESEPAPPGTVAASCPHPGRPCRRPPPAAPHPPASVAGVARPHRAPKEDPSVSTRTLRTLAAPLVGAIALIAFAVSFEAISAYAAGVGAFPHSLRWCAPLLVTPSPWRPAW